ncbi:hypothetical protein H5410_053174 [Solanum commersonii]|uniref:Myb-like domain-containing protein n=1 Tax=Solanum commersonii TaxID=4109 RepID=A0A9J5X350_SOLCO|nr:hypothetical protein H5410_053174 [Solanum commersonii]
MGFPIEAGRIATLGNLDLCVENDSPMSSLGVRKGSWTDEEDFVLRKCLDKRNHGKM